MGEFEMSDKLQLVVIVAAAVGSQT